MGGRTSALKLHFLYRLDKSAAERGTRAHSVTTATSVGSLFVVSLRDQQKRGGQIQKEDLKDLRMPNRESETGRKHLNVSEKRHVTQLHWLVNSGALEPM